MIRSLANALQPLAAPIADHLWQSTLFALMAACLTLFLRKNPARVRFTIWLVASLKFLVPFAVLVRIGHALSAGIRPPRHFVAVFEIVTQPFAHATSPILHATFREALVATLPALLGALWLAGVVLILLMWWSQWLRVSRTLTAATPVNHGLEFDCLQSIRSAAGISSLPILLSSSRFEPGIFGIFRPVLLWPAGMSSELREPEIHAILAHEVCHARRYDNLAAALQMLIEAIFWFHPLVWWLGSRQMEEREHACDEGALALGSEPAVYAEGILKTCKFCIESPLPWVAGVNGSNLKKRMMHIMNNKDVVAISRGRKLMIGSLALANLTTPVLIGINSSPQAVAQAGGSDSSSAGPLVVTAVTRNNSGPMTKTLIKHTPDGVFISNITVKGLIKLAYSVQDYQLTGGPAWIDQDGFDIAYTGGGLPSSDRSMVSNSAIKEILAQQFHLVIRQETKPGPAFALVVADGGVKFPRTTPPNAPGTNEPLLRLQTLQKDGHGQISIIGSPEGLADTLSAQIGHPIVDKTGLTGIYSINFEWATTATSTDTISEGLRQQLGLTLVPQDGPVETAVIESVTTPAGS